MLSLVWLHMGTIVCCASFQTQIMSGTTIRPASKTPFKKEILAWYGHMGTIESFRPVEFEIDRPQKHL